MTGTVSDRCVAGIDVGSTLTKVVVYKGATLVSAIGRTGSDYIAASVGLLFQAMDSAGLALEQLAFVVATGYGRRGLPFADHQQTEIACHARGVTALFPGARTIIEIGGQDAKGIKVSPTGKVLKFVMNDKCAAGTGRFIEVVASTLGLSLDELQAQSLGATEAVTLASKCTLFAEQELAQSLADGQPLANVIAGLHKALASRVYRMVRGLGIEDEIIFTGGCARNRALVRALEECLRQPLLMPEDPELTGAFGAALLAAEHATKGEPTAAPERLAAYGWRSAGAANNKALFVPSAKSRDPVTEGTFVLHEGATKTDGPRAGVDAGALFTKAVVVHGGRVSFAVIRSSGNNYASVAKAALDRALHCAGLPAAALEAIVATGRGAGRLPYQDKLDDLACLASGMYALFPEAEQAIDIGGHGTRVVRLDGSGGLRDFVAPGKCAAGGARVLETMAHLLGHKLGELGDIAQHSNSPAPFSAGCPVFAETEAISLRTRGTSVEDLLAGLHESLASRVMVLARTNLREGVRAIAGGGAKDGGLVERLRPHCQKLLVPPEPMIILALGAALGTVRDEVAAGPLAIRKYMVDAGSIDVSLSGFKTMAFGVSATHTGVCALFGWLIVAAAFVMLQGWAFVQHDVSRSNCVCCVPST